MLLLTFAVVLLLAVLVSALAKRTILSTDGMRGVVIPQLLVRNDHRYAAWPG